METIYVSDVKLPTFEMPQMARDFGLDITVPDGGLVSSAVNQRQYKADCGRIYREFLVTMGDYIQEEEGMREDLKKLQGQRKVKSPVFQEKHVVSEEVHDIGDLFSRRGNRTFVTQSMRPLTAAGLENKRLSLPVHQFNRPSTVADFKGVNEHRRQSILRRSSDVHLPASSADGVMDETNLHSKERKLKINTDAFTKLQTGKVNVKLQDKEGQFVLKQVLTDSNNKPLTRSNVFNQDNMRDKTALVRKKTNFKSPTLSSDMKINNLVAIQKSLKGLPAKRISVGEIMAKAKDRRSRVFNVEVTSALDINGLYNARYPQIQNDVPDDASTIAEHDGIKMVRVEAMKNRAPSSCMFSQDDQDMRKYRESYLNPKQSKEPKVMKKKKQKIDMTSKNVYLKTSAHHGADSEDSMSEKAEESPRMMTTRDARNLIKSAMEEDIVREKELNKWRQRLTFASVKRHGLGRILSRANSVTR